MPSIEETDRAYATARRIFTRALEACRIDAALDRRIQFGGSVLMRIVDRADRAFASPGPSAGWTHTDLAAYQHILLIALGKAAVPMLDALLQRLPSHLQVAGVCAAPALPSPEVAARWGDRIACFAAGHPLPNADSFAAAQAALDLLRLATRRTFVMFLISGGGSALFELPLHPGISLEDTAAFHQALVGAGATIAEINVLRKHFSAVKGGRLAAAAGGARMLTLQVADVPLGHLDALASAPTLPDSSTVADCRAILDRYRLLERFPPGVRAFFASPHLPETPGRKARPTVLTDARAPQPDPAAFPQEPNHAVETLLSNADLLQAAATEARQLGYGVVIDNTCDDWDYREAAAYLLRRFREITSDSDRASVPLCLLSGGEVTVTLTGRPGVGGRNQQFALACGLALKQADDSVLGAVLSAGSDGVDGNSPAAGAIAGAHTAARARTCGFDPETALHGFNAFPLFASLGDAVMTGPTGNNLRDLRILLETRA